MFADDQLAENASTVSSPAVIRETVCKILNRSRLGDYSLNCYVDNIKIEPSPSR
ncbi:MAG: hypothetical protein ACLQNE_11330 [Thermoguttaceae bacterium]|jgi:hypothetical protein